MYVNQSEETSLPQNNFIGYSKRMKGAAVPDALGEREREKKLVGAKSAKILNFSSFSTKSRERFPRRPAVPSHTCYYVVLKPRDLE